MIKFTPETEYSLKQIRDIFRGFVVELNNSEKYDGVFSFEIDRNIKVCFLRYRDNKLDIVVNHYPYRLTSYNIEKIKGIMLKKLIETSLLHSHSAQNLKQGRRKSVVIS